MLIRLFFLTVLLIRLALFWHASPPEYSMGATLNLEGTLTSEPTSDRDSQRFFLQSIQIITKSKAIYHYGDNLSVSGKITCPQKKLVCSAPYINQPKITVLDRESGNQWVKAAITVRSEIENNFRTHLSSNQANLLIGILLGGSNLDRNFKSQLANVGLTHIVAASGMNVTFMMGFFVLFLSVLRIRPILKVILVMIFIVFYSTITGFEPPIVRASIMAGFVLIASLVGRPASLVFALFLAAYLMLWADPSLLTSPSFLLSFTSMIGQIISSNIKVRLPIVLKFLADNFLQTLAAIIATFPIILIFFAKFSLISIITNTLVLWTIEPLMLLGSAAAGLGFLLHDLSPIFLLPASVLLDYFLKIVQIFNRPEYLLSTPPVGLTFALGYYLLLGSLLFLWHQRYNNSTKIPTPASSFSSMKDFF